ncbi:MAG: hypothetical protein H2054_02460 [Sphingomonas sp.]|nr:hypothetical protein [Sphingomonas sp.]
MLKLFKSPLLWQISGGFALGTLGMMALAPANAVPHQTLYTASASSTR